MKLIRVELYYGGKAYINPEHISSVTQSALRLDDTGEKFAAHLQLTGSLRMPLNMTVDEFCEYASDCGITIFGGTGR